jgi:hypothetical protein
MQNMLDNENPVSKEFPELFHYTNVSAFTNIYKERIFRATYYEDLNDKSELRRFGLRVRESVRPLIREHFRMRMQNDLQFSETVNKAGGIDTLIDQEASMLSDKLHEVTFGKGVYEPFVCSFCAHSAESYEAKHGLLSQWRAYAAGGVAIVLDTRGILKTMQHELEIFAHPINHIGNVDYDNDDERIKKDFSEVFKYLPEIIDKFYANEKPPVEKIFERFIIASTLVKHHAFCEEKEVRIVVASRPNKDSFLHEPAHNSKPSKKLRYMQRGNREVRYIELFGNAPLPIKRVIIGPSQIQNLNCQNITDLVQDSNIEVLMSDTPFLD